MRINENFRFYIRLVNYNLQVSNSKFVFYLYVSYLFIYYVWKFGVV